VPLPPDIGQAIAFAVARAEKELGRYAAAGGTVRHGGIGKLCQSLDDVLRATAVTMCLDRPARLDSALLEAGAHHPAKATTGQLAKAVQMIGRDRPPTKAGPRKVYELLTIRPSPFWRFLELRNRVVHGGTEPTAAELEPIVKGLVAALKRS
jgi:hypothetical protein